VSRRTAPRRKCLVTTLRRSCAAKPDAGAESDGSQVGGRDPASTFTTGTSVMAMSCQRSSYELTASVHRGARTISPSFGFFGVAGCITDAGSGRAGDVRISDARSNEEPIGFDPIALAIHMRVDAMCPFRPGSAVRGGDVVRRGANPRRPVRCKLPPGSRCAGDGAWQKC
jgi:hypothetical protein